MRPLSDCSVSEHAIYVYIHTADTRMCVMCAFHNQIVLSYKLAVAVNVIRPHDVDIDKCLQKLSQMPAVDAPTPQLNNETFRSCSSSAERD